MNYYNNIPLNCFNTLVTDAAKLDTYFKVEVKELVSEKRFVWVDPETFNYGVDGKQYSCMDCNFYEWNNALLSAGLSVEQMEQLNNITNTRLNFNHRAGWWAGEKHAKSMAITHA